MILLRDNAASTLIDFKIPHLFIRGAGDVEEFIIWMSVTRMGVIANLLMTFVVIIVLQITRLG